MVLISITWEIFQNIHFKGHYFQLFHHGVYFLGESHSTRVLQITSLMTEQVGIPARVLYCVYTEFLMKEQVKRTNYT